MKKSKGSSIRTRTAGSCGYTVNREAEETAPTPGAAGGAQSGIGTGEERVWGPGVCRGPVSASDEVTEFVESGEMARGALAGLTGL